MRNERSIIARLDGVANNLPHPVLAQEVVDVKCCVGLFHGAVYRILSLMGGAGGRGGRGL